MRLHLLKNRIKRSVDTAVVPIFKKAGPIRQLIAYVGKSVGSDGYHYLKEKFIQNGEQSQWDKKTRKSIIERFEVIDRAITTASSPTDGLFLAEALLSMEADGSVIECGCYNSGSTAKLSIITKILGRKLYVFDSFEGLPEIDGEYIKEFHARYDSKNLSWKKGIYAAELDQVKSKIEKYGEISVCTFIKGWFIDTLKENNLPGSISFAFTDVDLPDSARDCLATIWPRLSDKGIYFSHDVAFIKVLQTILDENLWMKVLKQFPPILFGAGSGLVDSSPHLGFFIKGKDITAEYINSLTIKK